MRRSPFRAVAVAVLIAVAGRPFEVTCTETAAVPRLRAIAVAPTEIRLEVELDGHSLDMSAMGGADDEPCRFWYVSLRQALHDGRWRTHGRAVVIARPDTTYRFRVRAEVTRGSGTETRASNEYVLRAPAEPRSPPTTPAAVTVAARSPFVLEVRWRSADTRAYGFEIERRDDAGEFRRAGIAEPDARRFVDHGRLPSTTSTYRVRAFNPRGVSAWSAPAPGVTRRLAELTAPPRREPRAPCTTLDAVTAQLANENAVDDVPAKTVVCRDIALDARHRVDAVTLPALCGVQNCGWSLYGEAGGCYRALGSFELDTRECPRFGTLATAPDGWPVLSAGAHDSAVSVRVAVHAFLHGEYVAVDDYIACAPNAPVVWPVDREMPPEDPTRWSPPFHGCWMQ